MNKYLYLYSANYTESSGALATRDMTFVIPASKLSPTTREKIALPVTISSEKNYTEANFLKPIGRIARSSIR